MHRVTFHGRLVHIDRSTNHEFELSFKLYMSDTSLLSEIPSKSTYTYNTPTTVIAATLYQHINVLNTCVTTEPDIIIRCVNSSIRSLIQ